MTTTVANPVATHTPPLAAVRRRAARRPLTLAAVTFTLAALAVGTWLIVERVAGTGASAVSSSATPAPSFTPVAALWLRRAEVVRLQKQLVRAGYSIAVDGKLDPLTKSALADYLPLDATHPLSPFLASALAGTWITGLRKPAAWNRRFGLNRLTRFVERPLTGPGGQLDANGNLRSGPR
jgi:Putative peptidoglycan binding domain